MEQRKHKSLVAVVVTYNRLDKLKVTLARLLASPREELSAVVVVDNASTDDTGPWLAEYTQTHDRLDVQRSATNEGGAGGFARGMRHAVARYDPDWLLLMDDDGRPEPDTLKTFHALDTSQWDALATAVYFPSGEICEMNRPSRNPFWHASEFWQAAFRGRAGFHLKAEAYARTEPFDIDVTSFVGFFLSRRGVELAGYPDPDLFLYGDDGIYTLDLRRKGGRIGFAPMLRYEHDLSTFDGQRGRFKPLWKVYYYHRNLLFLYRMAAGRWFGLVLLVIIPRWLLKIRDHAGERRPFARLMLRAIWHGLRRRKGTPLAQVQAWADKR